MLYFKAERRPNGNIVEFKVPNWFNDMVKEFAIPQAGATTNPLNQNGLAPKIADPKTPGASIEFPTILGQWLNEVVVPASGKVHK